MRLYIKASIFSLFFTAITGCMVGPDFHSPAAPQTQSYTHSPLPTKTVAIKQSGEGGKAQQFVYGTDIPAQWWTLYQSPELDSLIRQGLANSPTLAAAQATLRQAQENLNASVGNLLFPAVNAQAGGQRTNSSTGTSDSTSTVPYNLYNASVSVSYLVDIFGGSRRQIEGLRAQVDNAQYELLAANLTLTSNIVTTAVTVASLEAQIQATRDLVTEEQKQLTIIQKQLKIGGASTANVLSQQTQVAQTMATLPPLEKSLAQSQHSLAVLVGELPSQSQMPKINLDKLILPEKLPLSLPSSLVQQRPDVQASQALLHAASAQIGVATANMLPQLTLSANYGSSGSAPSDLLKAGSDIWGFAAQVAQPIFHGGALNAQRRAAIAAYDQANAQYRQTVLQAFQNVADALRAIQMDAETFKAQREAEIAARATLRVTKGQFIAGGASYLQLLSAQQQYQQARINRIQAQAARYTDTAALFQALGGGWWNQ
jgi:NodT family efflux transporter outer membrane factor (OMF) lipoprotein